MRIVFDCERMKYPYTGLFEYCAQLGKAIRNVPDTNADLIYYTPPQNIGYFGNQYEYIKQNGIHKFFPPRYKQIDIWHTTYQSSAYMKGGNKRLKRILTIHDLNFLYENCTQSKINKCLKVIQANIDKADAIIAISRYTKADVEKHLETHGKPIAVIYNGYNVFEYPDHNQPGYKPAVPFLFSIGTVLPKKNFHTLPCLLKNNDYELVIAGIQDADYVRQIISEAKKYGVENRVKLIGSVSGKDKYWYFKNCLAFLFPSLAEGFGAPPIEAMYFGKPVFLSQRTSLPEIGGRYAYYFNDFDADNMQSVFEKGLNHYIQTKPEELIKEHARQFNWHETAKAYWNIYLKIKVSQFSTN